MPGSRYILRKDCCFGGSCIHHFWRLLAFFCMDNAAGRSSKCQRRHSCRCCSLQKVQVLQRFKRRYCCWPSCAQSSGLLPLERREFFCCYCCTCSSHVGDRSDSLTDPLQVPFSWEADKCRTDCSSQGSYERTPAMTPILT